MATLAKISETASPLDTLFSGLLSSVGSKTNANIAGDLESLINSLVKGNSGYSKDAAIADSEGVIKNLTQSAMQSYIPSQAAATRGAGIYNSSTNTLLRNDADARLAAQLADATQKNILNYAQIQQGNANAAANATQASKGSSPSVTQQLLGAGSSLLLNEGIKFLKKQLGDSATSSLTDAFSSGASSGFDSLSSNFSSIPSALGIGSTDLSSYFNSGNAFDLGSSASNLFDSVTGGLSDVFSSIGSGINDLLGIDFFANGGVIPGNTDSKGRDTKLIAAQGGEAILPKDVVDALGGEEAIDALIREFHTPVKVGATPKLVAQISAIKGK